ncbi:hypothetical protein ALC62_08566 [Cyphomyrmex costatus]|uniref:Uncharacterized protein n=1 Tax=Cyphomyrmex costatus TaxID=456900 RepID=A0A151IGV5_9HYME|nr:hypothetical protein ALC62_08566 [Cyphomyrmex costatus]
MQQLRPRLRKHGTKPAFIFKDLENAKSVFLRHDAPRGALQAPYDGPYEVLERQEKTYKIRVKGQPMNVSIDRLKPAYTIEDATEQASHAETQLTTTTCKRATKPRVRFAR